MSDQWMIKGAEFVNCNCDFGCPCQFSAPSTYGKCEAIANFKIDEGYFNDTRLDGLHFITIMKWPGEIAEGNGEALIIIDEKASPEQREALVKIATGQSTSPGATIFSVFAGTLTTVHETQYKPIDMSIDVDNRQGSSKIEGIVESKGTSLINPFSGNETRAVIHLPEGFEYIFAEMGVGTTQVNTDFIDLSLTDSYGQFAYIHLNQDGVIRDKAA